MSANKDNDLKAIGRLYDDIFTPTQTNESEEAILSEERPFPEANIPALLKLISELPDKEAAAIRYRYGLPGAAMVDLDDDQTLELAMKRLRDDDFLNRFRVLSRTHEELVAQMFSFEQRKKLLEWAVEATMPDDEP